MTYPLPITDRTLKKPPWLRVTLPGGEKYGFIKQRSKTLGLSTVCEEARCPNIGECWASGTATFMILGDTCTRGCRFCSVKTSKKPPPPDAGEPMNLSETIFALDLDYAVITTVDRDDLSDQGAHHIFACIKAVQERNPTLLVEILMPDFCGQQNLIDHIVEATPNVIAHNIETVRRLTGRVRDRRAGYDQSLGVLNYVKKASPDTYTKSSIMVGLGETKDEVTETMKDLRCVGVDFLTIGQYLRPRIGLLDVEHYVHPDTFKEYEEIGLRYGFKYVASGPLVRSSYKAAEHFVKSLFTSGATTPGIASDG